MSRWRYRAARCSLSLEFQGLELEIQETSEHKGVFGFVGCFLFVFKSQISASALIFVKAKSLPTW